MVAVSGELSRIVGAATTPGMNPWVRLLLVSTCTVLAALLCSRAGGMLIDTTGGRAIGLLYAALDARVVFTLGLIFAGLTILCVSLARWSGVSGGLFVFGAGASMLALSAGTSRDLAVSGQGIGRVPLESGLWVVLLIVIGWLIHQAAGASEQQRPRRAAPWLAAGIGAAVSVGIVLMLAVDSSKGQSLTAVAGAALVGAFIARLFHHETGVVPMTVCIGLALVLVQGWAWRQHGAIMVQTLPLTELPVSARLLLIAPLDLLAGIPLGVAVGSAWAASLYHEQVDSTGR